MIVPRSRMLFWVAAIVLPFAFLAAVVPAAATVSLAVHQRTFVGGDCRCD